MLHLPSASYKGSTVRKELVQKLFPALREKKSNALFENRNPQNENHVKHGVLYSEMLNKTPQEQAARVQKDDENAGRMNKLEEMMANLIQRMDSMLNLITVMLSKLKQS